jgi:hypothetical protein
MNVNFAQLTRDIFRNSKNFFLEQMNALAEQKFGEAKGELFTEILEHPVAQELNVNSALEASSSKYLSGAKGNLYSFIGFRAGYNPSQALIKFLDDTIRFIPATSVVEAARSLRLKNCFADFPSRSDFDAAVPLAWQPGLSWPHAIEEGISGLGHYLFIYHEESRSGKGIETPLKVNSLSFTPISFITPILERFKNRLNSIA